MESDLGAVDPQNIGATESELLKSNDLLGVPSPGTSAPPSPNMGERQLHAPGAIVIFEKAGKVQAYIVNTSGQPIDPKDFPSKVSDMWAASKLSTILNASWLLFKVGTVVVVDYYTTKFFVSTIITVDLFLRTQFFPSIPSLAIRIPATLSGAIPNDAINSEGMLEACDESKDFVKTGDPEAKKIATDPKKSGCRRGLETTGRVIFYVGFSVPASVMYSVLEMVTGKHTIPTITFTGVTQFPMFVLSMLGFTNVVRKMRRPEHHNVVQNHMVDELEKLFSLPVDKIERALAEYRRVVNLGDTRNSLAALLTLSTLGNISKPANPNEVLLGTTYDDASEVPDKIDADNFMALYTPSEPTTKKRKACISASKIISSTSGFGYGGMMLVTILPYLSNAGLKTLGIVLTTAGIIFPIGVLGLIGGEKVGTNIASGKKTAVSMAASKKVQNVNRVTGYAAGALAILSGLTNGLFNYLATAAFFEWLGVPTRHVPAFFHLLVNATSAAVDTTVGAAYALMLEVQRNMTVGTLYTAFEQFQEMAINNTNSTVNPITTIEQPTPVQAICITMFLLGMAGAPFVNYFWTEKANEDATLEMPRQFENCASSHDARKALLETDDIRKVHAALDGLTSDEMDELIQFCFYDGSGKYSVKASPAAKVLHALLSDKLGPDGASKLYDRTGIDLLENENTRTVRKVRTVVTDLVKQLEKNGYVYLTDAKKDEIRHTIDKFTDRDKADLIKLCFKVDNDGRFSSAAAVLLDGLLKESEKTALYGKHDILNREDILPPEGIRMAPVPKPQTWMEYAGSWFCCSRTGNKKARGRAGADEYDALLPDTQNTGPGIFN